MIRATFLAIMAVRRSFTPGSADHDYLSRSARKMVWLMLAALAALAFHFALRA